jgi:hypothetical protein
MVEDDGGRHVPEHLGHLSDSLISDAVARELEARDGAVKAQGPCHCNCAYNHTDSLTQLACDDLSCWLKAA